MNHTTYSELLFDRINKVSELFDLIELKGPEENTRPSEEWIGNFQDLIFSILSNKYSLSNKYRDLFQKMNNLPRGLKSWHLDHIFKSIVYNIAMDDEVRLGNLLYELLRRYTTDRGRNDD